MSTVESGEWLITNLAEMDRRESAWLEVLAEFDRSQGWALDGQLSCVDWLIWKGRMGRATAYEKLLVARQLSRRPILKEAFAQGRVSYSALRVIARMEDPDPEVDQAMVDLAEAATVRDVERVAATYRRHTDQHRRSGAAMARRDVRVRPNLDGTSTLEVILSDLEVDEAMAVLQAFLDSQLAQPQPEPEPESELQSESEPQSEPESEPGPGSESEEGDSDAAGQSACADADAGSGPSARADWSALGEQGTWGNRVADAFMEMVRTGLAHAREGQAAGDDRYMVHVVSTLEGMVTVDGEVIDAATAERIACDCARVEHIIGPHWEPLALGRKTREWTTAQRRAAKVRDGGRCRFPGCHRRVVDLHHCRWWTRGGPTDISNGILCCPRHHTLLHSGYGTSGDANHEVTFHRPDGSVLGESRPRRDRGGLTAGRDAIEMR